MSKWGDLSCVGKMTWGYGTFMKEHSRDRAIRMDKNALEVIVLFKSYNPSY